MKVFFQIADIKIQIDSCVDFEIKDAFSIFLYKEQLEDADICIDIKEGTDQIEKLSDQNLVFDNKIQKVYRIDGVFYRATCWMHKTPYMLLVEKPNQMNCFECYIFPVEKKKKWLIWDIFTGIGFEYLLQQYHVMILHASFICWEKQGILFTAPSQTGKSTQANLWRKYEDAVILNGDRAAICKKHQQWLVYGLPFAGSSGIYKNEKVKLGAIVVLRQGEDNQIRKLNSTEAFRYLYSETLINMWNQEYVKTIMSVISNLISEISIYMLTCRPNEGAVNVLKKKLYEDNIIIEGN